jgi:dynein heavy chain
MKTALSEMTELKSAVKETMAGKIDEWASGIKDEYKDRLKQPLITRDPETRLLSMNFDPELYSLLQEVQFLSRHMSDSIPAVALDIYQQNQVYHDHIHKIQVLVERYNHPLSSIVDVERPMFQEHIDKVDRTLERGITELTWEDEASGEFLDASVQEVSEFSELHNTSTSNIATIKSMIESWREPALFSRTDPKKSLDAAEVNNGLREREEVIRQQAADLAELVHASVAKLTDRPDSAETKQYLDHVAS